MTSQTVSLTQRVAQAITWNTLLLPFKFALVLGSGMVLVRVLNKADYSIYTLVLGTAALLGTWIDLGMERSVARFAPEIEAHAGRGGLIYFFNRVFALKFALLVPIIVALALAPEFFIRALALDKGGSGTILLWAIVGLLLLGMIADVFIQFLYTHFRQVATNLLDLIGALVQPLVVMALALAGTGVVGLVAGMLASSLLLDLLAGWQARRAWKQVPLRESGWPRQLWKRFFYVSGLNFLTTATASLTEPGFANLVLTGSRQLTEVAIMTIGYRYVIYFLRYLLAPLTGIQTPLFARLVAEQRLEALREAYAALTKFLIFTLVPSGLVLILLAPRLIPFLFTTGYAASVPVAAVLVVLLFAETIVGIPLTILIVSEAMRAVIASRLVAVLSVPLLLLLAPAYGAPGAAVAIGAPRFLARLVNTAQVARRYRTRFPFAFLWRVLAASTPAAVPLILAREADWIWLLAATIGFVLLFAPLFKLVGGFDAQEKQWLSQIQVPFKQQLLNWF